MSGVFGPWLDYTVNGLIIGNIYALLAVGLALIFGVYRFLSIALSTCNVIGNTVATIVVAKLAGEFDETARSRLDAVESGA